MYNRKIHTSKWRNRFNMLYIALISGSFLFNSCDLPTSLDNKVDHRDSIVLNIYGTAYSEEDSSRISGALVTLLYRESSGFIGWGSKRNLKFTYTGEDGSYELTANTKYFSVDCFDFDGRLAIEASKAVGDSIDYHTIGSGFGLFSNPDLRIGCTDKPQKRDLKMRKWGPFYYETDYYIEQWVGKGNSGAEDGNDSLATFNNPSGIDLDELDNIYVADTGNHRIRKIDPGKLVDTYAGSSPGFQDGPVEQAQFSKPVDVAVTPNGDLIVVDQGNYRIRRISSSGEVKTIAGNGEYGDTDGPPDQAEFTTLQGVAVAGDGTIFVSMGSDTVVNDIHKIRVISTNGEVHTLAGMGPSGFFDGPGDQAQFSEPTGLELSPDGNTLYVADRQNVTVRTIDLKTGFVSTLAGEPGIKGNIDGSFSRARFRSPTDIVTDRSGNLYVVDYSKVRKLSINGWVTSYEENEVNQLFFQPLLIQIGITGNGQLIVTHRSNRILKYWL